MSLLKLCYIWVVYFSIKTVESLTQLALAVKTSACYTYTAQLGFGTVASHGWHNVEKLVTKRTMKVSTVVHTIAPLPALSGHGVNFSVTCSVYVQSQNQWTALGVATFTLRSYAPIDGVPKNNV